MAAVGRPTRGSGPRDTFAREIVKRLAVARHEAGMTRAELSKRASVSSNTIGKIETGSTIDPGFSVVVALADALGLAVPELISAARSANEPRADSSGVVPQLPRPST